PTQISRLVGNSGGIEGYAPFSLFTFRWAGLDPATGYPVGYLKGQQSKDWGLIAGSGATLSDINYVGSRIPTAYGSIGNTFTWKSLSVSARITYKFNYFFQRESINYTSLVNASNGHTDYAKRWQSPGDEATTSVPSFVYPTNGTRANFYANSDILATKGDHVRFEYVNVSYLVPTPFNRISFFKKLRIYAVVDNVGVIWRANGLRLDPDFNGMPPTRT